MGPQWLKITNFEKAPSHDRKSWAIFECNVDFSGVNVLDFKDKCPPNPPLRVMSFSIKTVKNGDNNEIANISLATMNRVDTEKNIDITT